MNEQIIILKPGQFAHFMPSEAKPRKLTLSCDGKPAFLVEIGKTGDFQIRSLDDNSQGSITWDED